MGLERHRRAPHASVDDQRKMTILP